ncbi:hypothetical protein QQS21_002450, partial [Conoideocrella luteorostrata]
IADALDFIHNAGVTHGDLTTANICLDKRLDAKLADFAGSSIDSLPPLVAVTVSHEHPRNPFSIQGDIFAFGPMMCEVVIGERPFAALGEAEVRARYQRNKFPDTTSLGSLGYIIKRCWESSYKNSTFLVKDLAWSTGDPSSCQPPS